MQTTTIKTISKMVESLPEDIQERIADRIKEYIADITDELKWDNLFKQTHVELSSVAKKFKKEILKGNASPFNYGRL